MPPDELPNPVPAPEASSSVPLKFDENGRFADKDTAREAGRRGGLARAQNLAPAKLLRELGLKVPTAEFKPYYDAAVEFKNQHLNELAKMAGGRVGTGPRAMVMKAAWALAWSTYLCDREADKASPDMKSIVEATNIGDKMKTQLSMAYEYAIKEAQVRPKEAFDPLAGYRDPEND